MKKLRRLEKIIKNMDYKLTKYSTSYQTALTTLLNNSFHIENKDKKRLVLWKYFDNYLGNKTITYIALDEERNVVGHYTNLPIGVTYLGKTYRCMICTDMCTDIQHRGKGLITKLSAKVYNEVRKNNYDFSIGFSNDDGVQVDKHSNSYGYVIVGKFVRYFKIVVYRKNISYKLEKTNTLDKDYYSHHSKYLRIKKDHDFLYWRYLKKPNREYEIYNIKENNKIIGYVILRFLKFKCYIYDIITENDNKKHMITVLRSIENKALEHNVRLIIYNVLENKYWQSLFNKYKYFKKANNNVNYYLTIKIHNDKVPKDIILDHEHWLLMNGDIL